MLQIIISALILCAALYLVAKNEAEISFPVILMITFGVSVVSIVASLAIGPFSFLVSLVVLAWAIQRFCYVRRSKAWTVAGIYAVANIGMAVAFLMLRKA